MKISEYICKLQEIASEHGDLEVETLSLRGDRITATEPSIEYRKILSMRESKPSFWCKYEQERDNQGQKVVKI